MKPMIEAAINDICSRNNTSLPGKILIADLGCSSGPNALALVSTAVEAIHNHCLQFQQIPPEVCVLLNDLPNNDFNTVVKSLVMLRHSNKPVVVTGVAPGSFYERLFTSDSIHLVCSSNSLHWLSKAPEDLTRNQIPAYDIDEHARRDRLPVVLEAYAKQFRKDFTLFLELRAKELVQGGRMVVSLIGRRSDVIATRFSYLSEIVAQILSVMVSEGDIDKAKFDSFYVHVYSPSSEELRDIIQEVSAAAADAHGVPSAWCLWPQQPPVQQQQQPAPGGDMLGKTKSTARGKKKLGSVQQNSPSAVSSNAIQMSYTNTICMCCGEPGHHQAACGRTPMCFICKATSHLVEECPVRKRSHQLAKYVGSGASGLGFYHIEMPETVINPVGSTRNCGIVIIEGGEVSKEELYAEFAQIYKTNWPWQIRELGQSDVYLVKFPSHLKVEEVIGYPKFGLKKKGIWVKVEAWNDDPEPVEVLKETWIKVTGLQTKWCEWTILDQAVSVCGLLLEVDWLSVFTNNAQEVRVKVHCRDPSKVPPGRLFGYHGNLFHLGFTLESVIPNEDNDDLLGEELEDQSKRDAEGSNQGGQDNGGGSGTTARPQSFSLGNINQASANDQYSQKDQVMEAPLGENYAPPETSAAGVYQILLQRGLVDQEGAFVWDKTPVSCTASEEVKKFWYSEKMLKGNLTNQFEETAPGDDAQEVELPDDIRPEVEIPFISADQLTEEQPPKRRSKWGPVQPVSQSNRIDRSKNIMEKAQEMKKINNLEIPRMKGIMSNNPFNVLQVDELDNAAKVVGINLDVEFDSMHSACSSPRVASLSDKDQQGEFAEEWIDVIRKSRGKHPKKFYP
ncbi:hypothetical protein QYE76_029846 [Lolium multiflorum]|uniref:CCHC-type domain-containing protein n=1 Tax=Lolium multiflorum TaxID=4521 RepID=A0AAD8QNN3_LOLMU|nr:hypothetical protein QYE76_029846 [Lolium multiflorum]